jgi:hypothetical protein
MGLSILGEVELAPLPGNRREHRPAGCPQSHVIITDHQFDSLETSSLESLQKLPPVDFRFTKRGGDSQNLSLPPTVHSKGFQDGQILDRAVHAHLPGGNPFHVHLSNR